MKAFQCDACNNLLFFENVTCLSCGHTLGFLPQLIDLCALDPTEDKRWKPFATSVSSHSYRKCQNSTQYQICNWMVSADDPNPLCSSCRLNLVIPDLTVAGNRERWHKLELA